MMVVHTSPLWTQIVFIFGSSSSNTALGAETERDMSGGNVTGPGRRYNGAVVSLGLSEIGLHVQNFSRPNSALIDC